jgi:membrane protease YdiL (CAAX protease family)
LPAKYDHRLGLRVLAYFLLIFVAYWMVNAVLGVGPNWLMKQLQVSPNLWTFVGATLSYAARLVAVLLLPAWALKRVLGLDPWAAMIPTRGGWWKDLIFGWALGAGIMLALFAFEVSQGWLVILDWNWRQISPDAFLRNLWLAVLVNLFVAVGEESMFRGYLLTGLEAAWGKLVGLLVMAVVFASFHLVVLGAEETHPLLFVPLLAVPGLVLGWAYLRAGSLWLPIGIHFARNIFQDEILNLHGRGTENLVGAITRQQGPAWTVRTLRFTPDVHRA